MRRSEMELPQLAVQMTTVETCHVIQNQEIIWLGFCYL
jgi:hypothetical protein